MYREVGLHWARISQTNFPILASYWNHLLKSTSASFWSSFCHYHLQAHSSAPSPAFPFTGKSRRSRFKTEWMQDIINSIKSDTAISLHSFKQFYNQWFPPHNNLENKEYYCPWRNISLRMWAKDFSCKPASQWDYANFYLLRFCYKTKLRGPNKHKQKLFPCKIISWRDTTILVIQGGLKPISEIANYSSQLNTRGVTQLHQPLSTAYSYPERQAPFLYAPCDFRCVSPRAVCPSRITPQSTTSLLFSGLLSPTKPVVSLSALHKDFSKELPAKCPFLTSPWLNQRKQKGLA